MTHIHASYVSHISHESYISHANDLGVLEQALRTRCTLMGQVCLMRLNKSKQIVINVYLVSRMTQRGKICE